ncbi:oxidoreductase [Methanobrevibacter sp. 87.7]|uniref:NADP-dependent oxidoreductase n=1 Tax=Methanobrevibacter sp. 87.7 TaxID=387957 RepID=UPI000B4FFF2A|nr:NADP-dependent oxidoreductase [Methanobrevibacter sp. 87.7]OWT32483.1 oxidoreductase [Methanobrevibacter sp. 87.7]
MKAAQIKKYKKDISLDIVSVDKPVINDNQVLVKTLTAGVNPVDNMIIRGEVKLVVPYKMPLTLGNELVGEIVELGSNVKNFNIGDRIFSRLPLNSIGAFAEYVAIDVDAIAKVPEYLSDEEAAGVPLTALTAMQAFELLNVKEGKTIFISGGSGSFGAMAIPLAKSLGLKVITSGSGANKERVLLLGADKYIDYKKENYLDIVSDVDYVIDTLGGKSLEDQFSILKKGGSLVSLKGLPNKDFAKRNNMSFFKRLLFGFAGRKYDKIASRNNQKYYFIFVHSDGKQLDEVASIFNEKHIKPSIDEVFSFEDINKALNKVDNGSSKGKTIIKF